METITPMEVANEALLLFEFEAFKKPEKARGYIATLAAPLETVALQYRHSRAFEEKELLAIRDRAIEHGYAVSTTMRRMRDYLEARCFDLFGNARCPCCKALPNRCNCMRTENVKVTTIEEVAKVVLKDFDFNAFKESDRAREYITALTRPLEAVAPEYLQARVLEDIVLTAIRDRAIEQGYSFDQTERMRDYLEARCFVLFGNAHCTRGAHS